jgi:hypothetical protein
MSGPPKIPHSANLTSRDLAGLVARAFLLRRRKLDAACIDLDAGQSVR